MKSRFAVVCLLPFVLSIASAAPLGTAFTYQGRLNDNSNPANGRYDFTFTLYDAQSGGTQLGTAQIDIGVGVSNGLFTVALDFGSAFDGNARWLAIGVRTNGGGAFVALAPRQALTPTPYAVYGVNAGSAKTLSGVLPNTSLGGTYSQALTFNNSGNVFAGSGAGLTGVNADQLDGQHSTFYQNAANQTAGTLPDARLSGNVAMRAGGNAFTGNQTLASGSLGVGTANPTRRLQATETTTGALTYPLKISNEGDTTNTGVGILFQADSGGDRGKGAIIYERTGSWNRGSLHFLQNGKDDASIAGRPNAVMTIANSGDVGIGSTKPLDKLEVKGTMAINVSTNDGAVFRFRKGDVLNWSILTAPWLGEDDLRIRNESTSSDVMVFDKATGNVGVGTPAPEAKLHVEGNVVAGREDGTIVNWMSSGQDATCHRVIGTANQHAGFGIAEGMNIVSPMVWMYSQPGNAFVVRRVDYGASLASGAALFSVRTDGVTSVQTLTITGGADVAEPFPMSSTDIPKGAVVVIDEAQPGRLKISERAYDTRVAGIVSGANGIATGISLSQEGVMEGDRNIALSGRVYALADATTDAIKPGDLLTTSDTPGHAMKATDSGRAPGAILGKAMTGLQEKRGLVLVLVSLQ